MNLSAQLALSNLFNSLRILLCLFLHAGNLAALGFPGPDHHWNDNGGQDDEVDDNLPDFEEEQIFITSRPLRFADIISYLPLCYQLLAFILRPAIRFHNLQLACEGERHVLNGIRATNLLTAFKNIHKVGLVTQ